MSLLWRCGFQASVWSLRPRNQLFFVNIGNGSRGHLDLSGRSWSAFGCRHLHLRSQGNDFRRRLNRTKLMTGVTVACGTMMLTGAVVLQSQSQPQQQGNTDTEKPASNNPKQFKDKLFGGKTLQSAIDESRDLAQRIKDEVGAPGLVVAVSIDGQLVWGEGLGYANVESRVACKPESVMRIASISKPIAMTVVAKLMEAGKLDLDKPVQYYAPAWPKKTFRGEKVEITTRQLVSNLSGIRHYERDPAKYNLGSTVKEGKGIWEKGQMNSQEEDESAKKKKEEYKIQDLYSKHRYKDTTESLDMFKNDDLLCKPGTHFVYTTMGWTVISAVAEGASGKAFPQLLKGLFKDLGLKSTYLDQHEPLIYNRAAYYAKRPDGRLENTPWVDPSYKWAGGGLISTAPDLVKFGNIMLYSYQWKPDNNIDVTFDSEPRLSPKASAEQKETSTEINSNKFKHREHNKQPPGYLKPEIIKQIWTPVHGAKPYWNEDGDYGMGWVITPHKENYGCCREQRLSMDHSGSTVGSSSQLIVFPRKPGSVPPGSPLPQGIVVAIIANLQSIDLYDTALDIAKKFEQVEL